MRPDRPADLVVLHALTKAPERRNEMTSGKTKLPPLPLPDFQRWQYGMTIDHFTRKQMIEYGNECTLAAIEAYKDECELELKEAIDSMPKSLF